MGNDIFHSDSVKSLNSRIRKLIQSDQRSLPDRSKVFSAVARIQKFDAFPEIFGADQISDRVSDGDIELYRGISGANGLPGAAFAVALLRGTLHPGTQAAFGQGIYFATPSKSLRSPAKLFPSWSKTAHKHAKKSHEHPGIIVRASLKKSSTIGDSSEIRQFLAENKARAIKIFKGLGALDQGTFAAMLGFDALKCDDYEEFTGETTYLVLNRGSLRFQISALQVSIREISSQKP